MCELDIICTRKWPTPAASLASLVCDSTAGLLCIWLHCSNVLTKPNWTDLSLPHSSCFRWWSIGLLRYTHAPLILHRFTIHSHSIISLFFTFTIYLFHFHSTAWCKKSIIWFLHFLLVWFNKVNMHGWHEWPSYCRVSCTQALRTV